MTQEGVDYLDALKEAQKLGYAEANPTADVEGFDAMYKISILASLAFNTKITIDNVYREGITSLDIRDIKFGKEMGYTLKLLAIGKQVDGGIEVRVHPTFISSENPLASVNDSFNAVFLEGDAVGDIMLYGRGAGSLPTASAIVSDVIFAGKHQNNFYVAFDNSEKGNKQTKIVYDFTSKYYLRMFVKDEVGVLSKFTGVFAKNNVSIKEIIQVSSENGYAEILVSTHPVKDSAISKIKDKLSSLKEVEEIKACIRIED